MMLIDTILDITHSPLGRNKISTLFSSDCETKVKPLGAETNHHFGSPSNGANDVSEWE